MGKSYNNRLVKFLLLVIGLRTYLCCADKFSGSVEMGSSL